MKFENLENVKGTLHDLLDCLKKGTEKKIHCSGFAGSERAYLIARMFRELNLPMVLCTSNRKTAESLVSDLKFFFNEQPPRFLDFPGYNLLPFKFTPYHNETTATRIATLYSLMELSAPSVIVTTIEALLGKLIPKKELSRFCELVMVNEDMDMEVLVRKLVSGGYSRSVIVEEPGDFSVRGGIVDIFSPQYRNPFRIEFFGDMVESIRFFSPDNQRKLREITEATILPASEAIIPDEKKEWVVGRIRKLAAHLEVPVSTMRPIITRFREDGRIPGVESMLSLLYPKLDSLFDYFPDNALVFLVDPDEIVSSATDYRNIIENAYESGKKESRFCVDPDSLFLTWSKVENRLKNHRTISLSLLPVLKEREKNDIRLDFSIQTNQELRESLKNNTDTEHPLSPLTNRIRENIQKGESTFLVSGSESRVDWLRKLLLPYDLDMRTMDGFFPERAGIAGLYSVIGNLSAGFSFPSEEFSLITEKEIFGRKLPKKKRSAGKIKTELIDFGNLKQGDLIVHMDHGLGQYGGLVKLNLNGSENDYLLIEFRDRDKLYLPVDRLGMVQKYMGVEGIHPPLDKMGGKTWDKVRKRVKKSVEKIAGELLKIYAARKIRKGFRFDTSEELLREFEMGFPYEETPDQAAAIEDVLRDMADPKPMDRLICGDVGYGKTEVALRAAFVTVNNGKQVAVLVPTTVLAEQHLATFSERFSNYPVNIAGLSRFKTPSKQRETIKGLKAGTVDIVIGTHRLIQKDVEFKDLGLLVVDEEQRFGVSHKEKIKKIRNTVDVLALTATPIPRTLHMSMMGIRDISVISTPPELRKKITTYVCERDDAMVSHAIRKELDRNGQIFFIHNNIRTIYSMGDYLKRLVPEVRLEIAHGRMDEKSLEKVMFSFINHEIDLLLCTTIIESGIDIATANTILINRADKFGLAQMYQLKGRVGRSEEQAYAYLFVPGEAALTQVAKKRLKVLMEHTDLGAGFQIAMNDLQIRGGGSILGASQSGHIAAVGYDMYLKLMETAMSELKGEPVVEKLEPEINMDLPTLVPETYMADIDQRLSIYRRLTKVKDFKELADFKAEMTDRFGTPPPETENLFIKIMLRILCIRAGVRRLDLTETHAVFHPSEAHQKHPEKIVDLVSGNSGEYRLDKDGSLTVFFEKKKRSVNFQVKNILKEIASAVNA